MYAAILSKMSSGGGTNKKVKSVDFDGHSPLNSKIIIILNVYVSSHRRWYRNLSSREEKYKVTGDAGGVAATIKFKDIN